MKGRRVLVTGAGGFVGGALARGFAELGWDVLGLDRAFEESSFAPRVRALPFELTDEMPRSVGGEGGPDLVVHGAWLTTDPESLGLTRAESRARNLGPLTTALRFTLDGSPRAFVFLSSSGVFAAEDGGPGSHEGDRGLRDDDRATGRSPYAVDKREAEMLTLAHAREQDSAAAHVTRLGYLYGPGEAPRPSRTGVSMVASWIAAARSGRPLEVRGDDPVRDWTFAPDLAEALERLIGDPPAMRPVHLGSPYVHRDREVATAIASHFPGATLVTVPAGDPVKPPMIPSALPALARFPWTDLHTGIRRVLQVEAARL